MDEKQLVLCILGRGKAKDRIRVKFWVRVKLGLGWNKW